MNRRRTRGCGSGLGTGKLYYLCRLASQYVAVGSEVRESVGSARLAHATTCIAVDDTSAVEPADYIVEGRACKHILKLLACHRLVPTEGAHHDFSELSACDVAIRAEIRQHIRPTRLVRSAAGVAAHYFALGQPLGISVEGRAGRYVLE